MTKAELNSLKADVKNFEADIAAVTQKAILLYNILGKISNRLDEINQKGGTLLNFDEPAKELGKMFKPAV